MVLGTFKLKNDYWETVSIAAEDMEAIYDQLLEHETPMTVEELSAILVEARLTREQKAAEQKKSAGEAIYLPKDKYEVGQSVVFPGQDWQAGTVASVRPARTHLEESFNVIAIEFENGDMKEFASGLGDHNLNIPPEIDEDDPLLSPTAVLDTYGHIIHIRLKEALEEHKDFVYIAGRWFPSALLIDVNDGNLNLAEAILDMNEGGPLPTTEMLEQVGLPEGVNKKLAEFSLDLALQEDARFDEVGSAGKVSWFLKRMEPEDVQKTPFMLKYKPLEYDADQLDDQMLNLIRQLDDEYSDSIEIEGSDEEKAMVTLIFPHWRSGTLPLTKRLARFFPTAYESPRVRFKLIDGDTGEEMPGWVVRFEHYIYGLRDWYLDKGIMPGGKIILRRGENPGEVIVRTEPHRSAKEWVRTALIGADGGVVYAMLKQPVSTTYDDWMMVTMPADTIALDQAWKERERSPIAFEQVVVDTLRELAKLNPQFHVHAAELYSALNVVHRCPPEPLLALLVSRPWFTHVGDLHFRYDDSAEGK